MSVLDAKKRFTKAKGDLAQTFVAAMDIWQAQTAEGLSVHQRVATLTKTLKLAWPQTREWKYLCDACDDYGLRIASCPGDATCGRMKEHGPHEFGTPCWCAAGKKFRPAPAPMPEDFTQAGKAKSKPLTRLGR